MTAYIPYFLLGIFLCGGQGRPFVCKRSLLRCPSTTVEVKGLVFPRSACRYFLFALVRPTDFDGFLKHRANSLNFLKGSVFGKDETPAEDLCRNT